MVAVGLRLNSRLTAAMFLGERPYLGLPEFPRFLFKLVANDLYFRKFLRTVVLFGGLNP